MFASLCKTAWIIFMCAVCPPYGVVLAGEYLWDSINDDSDE